MKIAAHFIALSLLLVSCGRTPESDTSAKELAYMKSRDAYIEKLKAIHDPGPEGWKALDSLNQLGLDSLEKGLRGILAGSHFGEQGKISLESLIDEVGFGMLDGLVISRDSTTRLFYTSKGLFKSYFRDFKVDDPSPETLEKIFNSAFESDAGVTNFGLTTFQYKDQKVCGMVAVVAQDIGPAVPEFLYVFVPRDGEIYMAEKWLDKPMKERPECGSIWSDAWTEMKLNQDSNPQDTAAFTRRWRLEEAAWKKYSACYREALVRDPEFDAIKERFKELAGLLIDP